MKSLSDVRSGFLDFFAERGHAVLPSSPLVPRNDPTLLFTNAGMVQFKNLFTGAEKRPYSRATTVQKCVRAGGKHNDLDNVGYTARHHTFFEMLGNFSFGDYFKEEAILFAWDFTSKVVGLPKDKLLVTVYPTDDQARQLWKKIAGISDDRIIGHESNLWAMGPTGPCGYCSEIFYDQGPSVAGGPPGSADEDGDRFLEFWNLVFMQFEQVDESTRLDLPKPSIDTGMGLERIAAILQGETNNYNVDLFRHLIAASESASGVASTGEATFSHRIISDHLRASSFLIADGVLPSNEGRGYVLRRIMRRAMRHAHLLGTKDPLMHRLVPALVGEMGSAYPELKRSEPLIAETLKLEEIRFRETLARGLKLLDEASIDLKKGDQLKGEVAFKLYDTYGFPLDLTEESLRARGVTVDTDGFSAAMQKQKAEARASWSGSGEAASEAQWFAVLDEVGRTEFLGYDTEEAEGQVLAIFKDGGRVMAANAGEAVEILTNQTPFYGESGGQAGDVGHITVSESQGPGHRHPEEAGRAACPSGAHYRRHAGAGRCGGPESRRRTPPRHPRQSQRHASSACRAQARAGFACQPEGFAGDGGTPALRLLASQAGQRRRAGKDRSPGQQVIRQNSDTSTRLLPTDQAIAAGAEALFGEKYGDEVRVLSMGADLDSDKNYSVELCGGTHVHRLGDIGLFTILAESAVAAGVRRIEALTSEHARRYLSGQAEIAREAASAIKTPIGELPARVTQLSEERRKLERDLAEAKKQLALAGPAKGGDDSETVAGVKAVLRLVEGVSPKDLKSLADGAKSQVGSGVVAFVAAADGKVSIVAGVTDDLTARISAVDLVRVAAEALGGKGGGGRPDMAQAGGPDNGNPQASLDAIRKKLGELAPALSKKDAMLTIFAMMLVLTVLCARMAQQMAAYQTVRSASGSGWAR
jgi:alanyl-tRNA synthetase